MAVEFVVPLGCIYQRYPFGNKLDTRRVSLGEIRAACRRFRFRLVVLLVRIWLLKAEFRTIFPFLVILKRLAAPRFVFILGIKSTPSGIPYFNGQPGCTSVSSSFTACITFFFFAADLGAKIITSVRPSFLGSCSITPKSSQASAIFFKIFWPVSGC